MSVPEIRSGLELLLEDPACLARRRVGLLCHPASVDSGLRHAASLLRAHPDVNLCALFGPQHGLRGETQDNMVEWGGYVDPDTGLPVHSLYGQDRKPTPAMLEEIDTLVIDLQDVGARYYTFIWTMLLCLEACAEQGKSVVVLDRPNPLGAAREGNLIQDGWTSFVGLAPVPMRHGLTVGELALWFAHRSGLVLDLMVVPVCGWRRDLLYDQTGLPWVMPSPNMPTPDTALVYPGMCLLEGTVMSEGRGTTRPFEIFGLPGLDPERLTARLAQRRLPGVHFRPLHFEPTFQKHAGRLCGGAQIHVSDPAIFRPVRTAVEILAATRELAPGQFAWREPPYEYETEKQPFDILAGGPELRLALEAGIDPCEVEAGWSDDLTAFAGVLEEFSLYG